MDTKVLAFLALVTIVGCNDVIVGLRTDGKKFFDESRQANPALWRQVDNVTISAPETEVISRVVITDLRPEKDGDVKVVQGGEGQNNVTIELKSPTVLRGYDFHIEVYSSPGQNLLGSDQSTTEIVQDVGKTASSNNPADATSKLPDYSTDKNVPAILTKDEEIKDGEREGRSTKIEDNISTEGTTESSSTTVKSDFSTTQQSEAATENHSERSSYVPNKFENGAIIPAVPSNKPFNTRINPIPATSGRDIANDKVNINGKDETRHARDTESEKTITDKKLVLTPKNLHQLNASSEEDKEATTTEISEAKPIENRKFTSFIPSKVEHPSIPMEVKSDKQRNARDANEEQKTDESVSTTTLSYESTTEELKDTSTLPSEDCVGTKPEIAHPVNTGKNNEGNTGHAIYLNNRQWNQRFNNRAFQTGDSSAQTDEKSPDDLEVYPAILKNEQDQSTVKEIEAERIGNDYKPSPDHMENRNPKISAITGLQGSKTPVISTQ